VEGDVLKGVAVALLAVVSLLGGFAAGYEVHRAAVSQSAQSATLSDITLSCAPSDQPPYLKGVLAFNVTSTYWTDVIVSAGYTGNWTGDTNQLIHPNSTKHVTVTWGPGMMQNIDVTQCPHVGVTIWRVVQTLMACPNPPCDDGTVPAL
jgi:hypothetical protein